MNHTYRIEIRQGFSAVDHLAPINVGGEYTTLAAARVALRDGRRHHERSKEVRCDIVRNDGRRFDWE
jgi:hypothetical protein